GARERLRGLGGAGRVGGGGACGPGRGTSGRARVRGRPGPRPDLVGRRAGPPLGRPDGTRGYRLRPWGAGGRGRAGACRLRRLLGPAEAVPRTPRPHSDRGARPVMTEAAYAEVERLTRQRARNFAYGIMLLPRPKRRAIAAV